jgi:hypothetical protein
MKTTTEKRLLECVMTQEEILHEAHVLSQAINRQTELENELKAMATQAKAQLAREEATIETATQRITSGKMYKMVDVVVELDYSKGTVFTVRADTYETIESRDMTKIEMQAELDLQEKETPPDPDPVPVRAPEAGDKSVSSEDFPF